MTVDQGNKFFGFEMFIRLSKIPNELNTKRNFSVKRKDFL